jgi:hypothetical protein
VAAEGATEASAPLELELEAEEAEEAEEDEEAEKDEEAEGSGELQARPKTPPEAAGAWARVGVGIRFGMCQGALDGALFVRELAPGGPAAASGAVQAGDVLWEVDGLAAAAAALEDIQARMAGAEGSSVDLVFRRPPALAADGAPALGGAGAEAVESMHAVYVSLVRTAAFAAGAPGDSQQRAALQRALEEEGEGEGKEGGETEGNGAGRLAPGSGDASELAADVIVDEDDIFEQFRQEVGQ